MQRFVSFLKGADTVAKFQELCGIVSVGNDAGMRLQLEGGAWESHGTPKTTANEHELKNGLVYKRKDNGKTDPQIANGKTEMDYTQRGEDEKTVISQNGISKMAEISAKGWNSSDGYIVRNKFLYHLFHFGANLGNEIFYITFFPFWFWNIDGFVGRRLCIFWCCFMYLGQALKDIIRIPRPASPPVVQLEKRYALEYGMPSTHAMVGTGIPFAIFLMTKERYIYPSELALVGAITWSCLVCCSRIYLGMHSLLDVIVGVGIVSAMMSFCFPLLTTLDDFILHSPYSPAVCILVPLLLCLFYPSLDQWSTARGDTTIIMAVGAGVGLGHWVCYQYGYMNKASTPPPYNIIPPTWTWAGLVVLRMIIGVVILVTIRAAVKTLTSKVVHRLAGHDRNDKEAHKTLAVELPCKFVTYSVIAFNMVYLAPMVFRVFGIERETFFTEI